MLSPSPLVNPTRLRWDISRWDQQRYEKYWEERTRFPTSLLEGKPRIWLEVGAGSGQFFAHLARQNPGVFFIAMERSRMRGKRLVRKAERSGLMNFAGLRANAIPALIHALPSEAIERVYLLYPCPWPKSSQRRNRWYLHPIMPHLLRILKPQGLLIWASDQQFYIDEARYVCESFHQMEVLAHGPLSVNPYNDLTHFPHGRTKFERTFLEQGLPCFELVVAKR